MRLALGGSSHAGQAPSRSLSNARPGRQSRQAVSLPVQDGIGLNECNANDISIKVVSNFEYSKAPPSHDSTVKVCVDKPLQLKVVGVTAANAEVRAVDLVVCSSGGDIVTAFAVGKEHLIVAADAAAASPIDICIAGSKRQYGLPKNKRSAIAAAKRQVPRYAADNKMTVRLRVSLVVQQDSGVTDVLVLADGDLEIATNRHRRHADQVEPVLKRARDEDASEADQLREELAAERRQMDEIKMQYAQLQALAQAQAQELAQLRQQCG